MLALAPGPQGLDTSEYLRAHRSADRLLVAGDWDGARENFDACLLLAPESPVAANGLACVEARAGNVDEALTWLERSAKWGYPDAEVALWDSDLESLRARDRFRVVIEAMRAQVSRRPQWTSLFGIWPGDRERVGSVGAVERMAIDMDSRTDRPHLTRGTVPTLGGGDRGLLLARFGEASIESATGRVLWHRVATHAGILRHDAVGHFDCEFDPAADAILDGDSNREGTTPLSERIEWLFDPKRVRASTAGVPIAPVEH